MVHFLLFVLMVTSQLIAGLNTQKLPPPVHGDTITILSVDGGALKGIIPAVLLDHLENALKVKDPDATLAKYFDVITGTSTGGLIAAMLASPSPKNPENPVFTPAEIIEFYKKYAIEIFNPFREGSCSIFDGEFLRKITREVLSDTRLSQMLTNVVIPTFDIKQEKPIIFSNYKLGEVSYIDAKMSDICISTSAAPIVLPPYRFENNGFEFNMIDGGAAAGNPTQAAISEVIRHYKDTKIIVLSLGTGETKFKGYDVDEACTWKDNLTMWLSKGLEFQGHASLYMTEHYLGTTFSGFQSENTYLRIQEYDLDDSINAVSGLPWNLDKIEEAGEKLLKENIVKLNLDTFDFEETGQGTYADALDRLAGTLYEERKQRLERKSKEKRGGRPFVETIKLPFAKIEAA